MIELANTVFTWQNLSTFSMYSSLVEEGEWRKLSGGRWKEGKLRALNIGIYSAKIDAPCPKLIRTPCPKLLYAKYVLHSSSTSFPLPLTRKRRSSSFAFATAHPLPFHLSSSRISYYSNMHSTIMLHFTLFMASLDIQPVETIRHKCSHRKKYLPSSYPCARRY